MVSWLGPSRRASWFGSGLIHPVTKRPPKRALVMRPERSGLVRIPVVVRLLVVLPGRRFGSRGLGPTRPLIRAPGGRLLRRPAAFGPHDLARGRRSGHALPLRGL